MQLKPVSTSKLRFKRVLRTFRSWWKSLFGIGISVLTLVGCRSRGHQLAGVQMEDTTKQDTQHVEMRLMGEVMPIKDVPKDSSDTLHKEQKHIMLPGMPPEIKNEICSTEVKNGGK